MHHILSKFIVFFILAGCSAGAEDFSFASKSSHSSNGVGNNNAFGEGSLNETEEEINYPLTEFYGTGTLISIDNNPIKVKTRQEASRTQIISETLEFSSTDKTINKNVRNLVGKTVYQRASREELNSLAKSNPNFKNSPIFMYAKSVSSMNKNGTINTQFSTPVPFLAIPNEMNYFEELGNNPITTTSTATDESGSYEIQTTLSFFNSEDNIARVEILQFIPSDTNGKLYDRSPFPRQIIYDIDTTTKRIVKMTTITYYYNSHKKKRRTVDINFNLCKYQVKDQVELNTCP